MTGTAPLHDLRLRTPRLVLRLGSPGELLELGQLAEHGIHPPEEMPFAVAWTDAAGSPGFLDDFVSHHEAALADWLPERWTLNLLVWAHGALVGTQMLGAERFAVVRRVHTGSWLGHEHQRRGIGTEMRAAVLELGFRGLGATVAESAWLEGNDSSRRVSEKLGYQLAGSTHRTPRGSPVPTTVVELDVAAWRCPIPVEIEGLETCLPLFGATPRP